jgi:hypothetical protein
VKQPGGIHADLIAATDWSTDGRYLAIEKTRYEDRQKWEDSLHVVDADTGKSVFEINSASDGKFSPDGHWLAYHEEESGEVYVTPFPGPGARIAVSSGGGDDLRWRGDGQELFYVSDDLSVVSLQVRESPKEFKVISSAKLFRLQLPSNVGFYDITRDGKRFLVNVRTLKEQSAALTVMTNWPATLPGLGQEARSH